MSRHQRPDAPCRALPHENFERLRLVVFDCDGTLVDSLYAIIVGMTEAMIENGLPPPTDAAIRCVVGLHLDAAIRRLLPKDRQSDDRLLKRVVEAYKENFKSQCEAEPHPAPLFPGIADLLADLAGAGMLLAVATGKSRRGLDATLASHGIADRFIALQTADTAPSKPHPAMMLQVMAAVGATPHEAVLIGDTSFDMQMALNAGCAAIGVAWGYHPTTDLIAAGAFAVATEAAQVWDHLLAYDRVARVGVES